MRCDNSVLRVIALAIVLILAVPGFGCAQPNLAVETVMTPGMKIVASTARGVVTIEATSEAARSYSGDGWRGDSTMRRRTERWSGSLGLYDPAPSRTPGGRLLVEEGRQHFDNQSDAMRFLQRLRGHFGPLTFSSTGLVVAYAVEPIPGQSPTRSVAVWQLYVAGRRPTSLPHATDDRLQLLNGTVAEESRPHDAPVGYQRELADSEYDGRP